MTALRDPKAMAKTLRNELSAQQLELSHSQCLEIVARQLGHADWNTATAMQARQNTDLRLPDGWFVTGTGTHAYQVGLDPAASTGQVTIYSNADLGADDGFVTLMQTVDAAPYRDKRLRLRGDLSSSLTDGVAGIWMRVDGFDGKPVRFDNMSDRTADGQLRGIHEWAERSIVLNVPDAAETISYGFLMDGDGQAWCRGFTLDCVDASVPVTSDVKGLVSVPTNLNFATAS